ncbi:hypothetical protein [Chitinophaga barathri]|uniref:Uncharacterized protein n=1 Tax=Chitinophaga barathri TaxID=1647451 RepID=A0A3N4N2A8_9BACT|nr:hypothetical protein [Chitinophaga barathri]RPD41763.1 hypothetical protein EG028_06235 [Chitinophaga barathri]
MKKHVYLLLLVFSQVLQAQTPVDLSGFKKNGATVTVSKQLITIHWPAGAAGTGKMVLNLDGAQPLFNSIQLSRTNASAEVAANLDPVFILRTGKRTLSPSSGGWDVFFDRVPTRPYTTELVEFSKRKAGVSSEGTHTIIRVGEMKTPLFTGHLEITLYNGSPLFNIAAVLSTQKDSTAILYDAGLISRKDNWKNIAWSDVKNEMQHVKPAPDMAANDLEVKYRTIIGENETGSLAVFPAPHQYFYPLDEAFNLKFTWYGNNYLNLVPGFAIGIRQDPIGDKRYVPWFNAPPGTAQRLNFFCLLSADKAAGALAEVKKFTHNDSYAPLPGYKTMASHFHNEFISSVVLSGKPVPEKPEFVDVLKKAGLDIVKLAEFHGPGHPKGPDSPRLKELHALFDQTRRLSDTSFLLLPGEEANNFYGGHWLAFFPKPVYWVMSRKPDEPFVTETAEYGKVYHVGDKQEMLKLLELENGLAWVAHARTKASTGFPDKYRNETFFTSDTYLGAAWKAIPADLSWQTLSKRVLNLMDDMANWGLKKHVIAEADIFTITHQNEMYAHLNVNYLQLDKLPDYNEGWQPVLDAVRKGKFFVSTGEVLIPSFDVNGKKAGETLAVPASGKTTVTMQLNWTFPLSFAEIVSGDGDKVYRHRINLVQTKAFGAQTFRWPVNLAGRKWVRVEVWDIAANGAFTQMVWL